MKFCTEQSFRYHLPNTCLVLLMRLVVIEKYLPVTPSVGNRYEHFKVGCFLSLVYTCTVKKKCELCTLELISEITDSRGKRMDF